MDRCSLFKKISTETWNRIKWNRIIQNRSPFTARYPLREETLTENLIFHFNMIGPAKALVFGAVNEPVEGNDIDLFIETDDSKWLRFSLQAKLGKDDHQPITKSQAFLGKYKSINHKSKKHGIQLENLINSATSKGACPLYLFFNHTDQDLSSTGFSDPSWFGCSVSNARNIRRAFTTYPPYPVKKRERFWKTIPSFSDLLGSKTSSLKTFPWHSLVCDYGVTEQKLIQRLELNEFASGALSFTDYSTEIKEMGIPSHQVNDYWGNTIEFEGHEYSTLESEASDDLRLVEPSEANIKGPDMIGATNIMRPQYIVLIRKDN